MQAWLQDILGPVLTELIGKAYWYIVAPIIHGPRFEWYWVLITLTFALAFYLVMVRAGRGLRHFVAFLLPKDIYLHKSAVLDYKYYALNQLVLSHLPLGRLVAGAIGVLAVADLVSGGLSALLGAREASSAGPVALVLFTLLTFMALDLGRYVAHYLAHKVPELWELHKVHHSVEVLTPISSNRAHPLDIALDFFFRLLFAAPVAGLFAWLYPSGIVELQILGLNAAGVIVFYAIAHLHHSHIRFGYGPLLSKVFLSPFMHQIHHSQERHHWDRNFGFGFALWDWLFGTIYVPQQDEPFRLGLPEGRGAGQYETLRELYLRPFSGIARLLAARMRPRTASAGQP